MIYNDPSGHEPFNLGNSWLNNPFAVFEWAFRGEVGDTITAGVTVGDKGPGFIAGYNFQAFLSLDEPINFSFNFELSPSLSTDFGPFCEFNFGIGSGGAYTWTQGEALQVDVGPFGVFGTDYYHGFALTIDNPLSSAFGPDVGFGISLPSLTEIWTFNGVPNGWHPEDGYFGQSTATDTGRPSGGYYDMGDDLSWADYYY